MGKVLPSCRLRILTLSPVYLFLQVLTWAGRFFVSQGPPSFPWGQPHHILLPVFLFSQRGKNGKLFSLIWAITNPFALTPTQQLLLQTHKTEIDKDCVCTKLSWAKELISERDFSPLFKTSLRF